VRDEKNIPAERTQQLRLLVQRRGVLSVREAQAALGVSRVTVRRDFVALEETGLVHRTRGGIVLASRATFSDYYGDRETLQVDAKAAIAKLAATLVEPRATLFIGQGTTCNFFAQALCDRGDLTVVSNSLRVIETLSSTNRGGMAVISTGGIVPPGYKDQVGHAAALGVARYRAQQAFISATAISEDGLFMDSSDQEEVARAMIDNAIELTVLADHTKLGKVSLLRVVGMSRVSTLVTDSPPPAAHLAWLSGAGVCVLAPGSQSEEWQAATEPIDGAPRLAASNAARNTVH
jgi:DeoR family transcriptional regulator, glycerol-3-phosphate regulon repressor